MTLAFPIRMNIRRIVFSAVFLTAITMSSLHATTVPFNVTMSGGANVVAAPSSDLANFSDSTVANWIAQDILTYNSVNNTTLPTGASLNFPSVSPINSNGANSVQINVTGY